MPETTTMDFVSLSVHSLGATVDRQDNVLRGYVMAMEGDFIDGRGSFNRDGLKEIVDMVNKMPQGLKSRWGHPSIFGDGLGLFLGRARNAYMDSTLNREGKRVAAVRGNLFIDRSAFNAPSGNLGGYLLDISESDPAALSSSLVILPRIDRDGAWYPERLRASDIVEEGAAVAGLLGSSEAVRAKLDELLNRAFEDEAEDSVREFMQTYLSKRYPPNLDPRPEIDARKLRLDEMRLLAAKLKGHVHAPPNVF